MVNLHDKPLLKNQFKFLKTGESSNLLQNEIDELKTYNKDQNNSIITVDTAAGKKSLNLPEISQRSNLHNKTWKKKKIHTPTDPYYYSVMREIYNTDEIIDKANTSKTGDLPENLDLANKKDFAKDFTEEEKAEYYKNWGRMDTAEGATINIKEVNAKDLTDFNWQKYKANLDKVADQKEQKSVLRPNYEQKKRNSLNTMAFELIEHEEIHGETSFFRGTAFKRNT